MDNGTVLTIEKLNRGAILGSYMFLVADENFVTATCVALCLIFTIDRARFTDLVLRDPNLLRDLLKLVKEMIKAPANELTLDFVQVKEHIDLPSGSILTGEEA